MGRLIGGRFVRIFLLLIPFFLGGMVFETAWENQRSRKHQNFERQAASLLERVTASTDQEFYVKRAFCRLSKTFRRRSEAFRPAVLAGKLKMGHPGLLIDVFLFDGSGALAGSFPKDAPNQWVMRQLMKGLCASSKETRKALGKQMAKVLQENFGSGKTLGFFAGSANKVLQVYYRGGRAWICLLRKGHQHMILFCRGVPSENDRFNEAVRVNKVAGISGVTCGYLLPTQQLRASDSEQIIEGKTLGSILRTPSTSAGIPDKKNPPIGDYYRQMDTSGLTRAREQVPAMDGVSFRGVLWAFRDGEEGRVFFAGFPMPRESFSLLWAFRLGMVVSWLFCFFLIGHAGPQTFSIRYLTMGLFLLAALVPVSGLIAGATILLDGRQETLANQVLRRQLETLKSLDQQFLGYLGTIRNDLEKEMPRLGLIKKPAEMGIIASLLRRRHITARVESRKVDGNIFYCNSSEGGGFYALLGAFTRTVLKKWAPERLVGQKKKSDPVDALFESDAVGFNILADRPRYLHPMLSGGEKSFFFWDFFPDPRSLFAFVAIFIRDEHLINNFVRSRFLGNFGLQSRQLILAAFHLDRGTWISPRIPDREKLVPLMLQASAQNRPRSGLVTLQGGNYRFVTMPARQLSQYCLVALYPDAFIQEQLVNLKTQVMLGLLLALFSALMLGWIVSRQLLAPLGDLNLGIAALHQRNFRYQIPVDRVDELGQLSQGFNEMLQGLDELNVARIVQAGLLPASYPHCVGFRLDGRAQFANDLGGDFLDCRVLKDGRILFLIGDVSGHGVASALIMAFVKAVVALWSENPDQNIGGLAVAIEKTLRQSGDTKNFFSAFYGILDPESRKMDVVSCGHPYPKFVRKWEIWG